MKKKRSVVNPCKCPQACCADHSRFVQDILFAALDELTDTANSDNDQVDSSDDSDDESSQSGYSEDDDDRIGSPFGMDSASNLPLVLMEDWTGNLVLAQPVFPDDTELDAPKSRSRSKGSRSGKGSGSKDSRSNRASIAGSTTNGDGTMLVVDAGATEAEDHDFDEDLGDYDGDTTDSLPEEDMPSPPEIIPFAIATAGIEANNASFGVTTVDEAALARDLGLPLADARQLLEAARLEEQQQLLGGVSSLNVNGGDVEMADVFGSDRAANPAASALPIAGTASNPVDIDNLASPGPQVAVSAPAMGSFVQDAPRPDRVAVIDGTGRSAPSPFVRRTHNRGRTKGTDRTPLKQRMIGESPAALGRRPRYSSVPTTGRPSFPRSPAPPLTRSRASYDREDTPTDNEALDIPMSLDEVLDATALHPYSPDLRPTDLSNYNNRQLSNLRRWERVPITTFRRSRNAGDSFSMVPSPTNAHIGPFRGAFSNPSMASTLAAGQIDPNGFAHGMVISPVLEAVQEPPTRHLPHSRRSDKKWKNRTASLGSMPALDLGR